jgi:hypothetical protein
MAFNYREFGANGQRFSEKYRSMIKGMPPLCQDQKAESMSIFT